MKKLKAMTATKINDEFVDDFIDDGFAEKPRLRIDVKIQMKDRRTGEATAIGIPLETDDPGIVIEWLQKALDHRRVVASVKSFVDGRMG